jgi:hypothetical protein
MFGDLLLELMHSAAFVEVHDSARYFDFVRHIITLLSQAALVIWRERTNTLPPRERVDRASVTHAPVR